MAKREKARENREITGKTLRFMLKTAWKEKPTLFLIYLMLFAAQLITKARDILLPKLLIDELALIIGGTVLTERLSRIVFYVALTICADLIAKTMQNVADLRKDNLKEWFTEYFEVRLAGRAMSMDFEHTENPDMLDQLNKAKEGIGWYSDGVVGILDSFYTILFNGFVLVGVAAIVLLYFPLLLPVQLAVLAAAAFMHGRNNQISIEAFKKLAKANRIYAYLFIELGHMKYGKDIRLYDSRDMMCSKTEEFMEENSRVSKWSEEKKRKNSWCMDIVNSIRDGISYFYIGYLALQKRISLGDFSMCVLAVGELYWSLFRMVEGGQEIAKKCSYAYQFLLFMEEPDRMPKGTRSIMEQKHVIEFRDVGFCYPRSDKMVLKNISLKIASGEHLSIVGLNGAGKTTFIKLLCRLYDVTEGEILIDGINIKEYSDEEYRKLFAVVFQDFQLTAFSLRENITCDSSRDSDARVEEALQLSGFYEDAFKLDRGLDTMLYKSFDEHGTELSGGQKQKTAISRALYRNAPIVILDEPTAALDPVAEYEIYRKFNRLVGGVATSN